MAFAGYDWRHSGFNVYRGPRMLPWQKKSLERLAAYLIRSSFSQERMEYLPDQARVLYRSKDGKQEGQDPLPTVVEPQAAKGFGKNSAWARFIQKVYEVDPLECPRCSGPMRVISFITDPAVVRRNHECRPPTAWLSGPSFPPPSAHLT